MAKEIVITPNGELAIKLPKYSKAIVIDGMLDVFNIIAFVAKR